MAPDDGGNPGSASLRIRRDTAGMALLAREVEELDPRHIATFTDRWWFAPFAEAIGANLEERDALVEAAGRRGDQQIVMPSVP